jgi:hypothetical protein
MCKNNTRLSEEKKNKRIRPELALPSIHYNNYSDARVDWLALFNLLDSCDKKDKKNVIYKYNRGIKYGAALKRFRRWVGDGKPQDGCALATQDNRGGHNAAMSVEEEKLCADYIRHNFLEKNKKINQEDVRHLIKSYYDQMHKYKKKKKKTVVG